MNRSVTGVDSMEYRFQNATAEHSHGYLWPTVRPLLPAPTRALDVGCGNGAMAGRLADEGWDVTGIDVSESGIAAASDAHPRCRFHVASAYDDLESRFGRFPVVTSFEVVEHLSDPRRWARTIWSCLEPGGRAIVSTPFHGYWKNLLLSLTNRWDSHLDPLWDCGHIKMWSVRSLTRLLHEAGFVDLRFYFAGRIRPLAKSMVVVGRRPLT